LEGASVEDHIIRLEVPVHVSILVELQDPLSYLIEGLKPEVVVLWLVVGLPKVSLKLPKYEPKEIRTPCKFVQLEDVRQVKALGHQ